LRSGDRGIGILDRLLVDLDVVLGGRSVVPCGLDVDQRLINALLFGLNRGARSASC
jgi:hypothetical protein